jgi:hypothetical protein
MLGSVARALASQKRLTHQRSGSPSGNPSARGDALLAYGTSIGVSHFPGPLWQAPLMQAPKVGQSLSRMQEMVAQPSSKPHTGPVVVGAPQRW